MAGGERGLRSGEPGLRRSEPGLRSGERGLRSGEPGEPGGGGPGERGGGARDREARAALAPLAEGERPAALLVALVVCSLLAIGVIVGALTVHDLSRHGGSVPGAVLLAAILALLALGMYRRRYWAVLGFEALLMFQLLVTSLALVVASTILAALVCAASIGLGGWLFWKLVRVMGRIQAGEHEGRAGPAGPG